MYVFGIVVSGSDGSPVGRASDALRAELPGVFPKFVFDFVGPEELELDRASPASSCFVSSRQTFSASVTAKPSARRPRLR